MHELEILFFVALVLYTVVIWANRLSGKLTKWMAWAFGLALTADMSGTVLVCIIAVKRWVWSAHTVFGLVSLVIMAVHFVWAVLALNKKWRFATYFERFSVLAWVLWLVAFISGIPR